MSTRVIASPKQRRGEVANIANEEKIRMIFSHLKKDKPEPADPKTNPWKIRPFKGIIRGDKHQSSLPHDVEVEISNGMQFADYLKIKKNSICFGDRRIWSILGSFFYRTSHKINSH